MLGTLGCWRRKWLNPGKCSGNVASVRGTVPLTGWRTSGRYARVSSYGPHQSEEDCLRGRNGSSGTIFFSHCNLRCVFYQNWDISQPPGRPEANGSAITPAQLAKMMLALQSQGCHNINFVTPEHVVPQIVEALPLAIENGLRLPLVYNTSAYDSLESLHMM